MTLYQRTLATAATLAVLAVAVFGYLVWREEQRQTCLAEVSAQAMATRALSDVGSSFDQATRALDPANEVGRADHC